MSDEEIGQLLTALGAAVQDNSTMVSALIRVLTDKKIITVEEFEDAKKKEEEELQVLIESALEELQKLKGGNDSGVDYLKKAIKNVSENGFPLMGKGGEA